MRFTRSSGILLHPTSLPGPYGSGDFGVNAYHFVDWLTAAGQKLWQILPLGGIGPGNSPYMSTSAFAGNILLIDLVDLKENGWLTEKDLQPDPRFQDQKIDFASVHLFRTSRLKLAAKKFLTQKESHQEFLAFCASEASWLEDYSLFMALADANNWEDWSQWDPKLAKRDEVALQKARIKLADKINFWRFCQWRFFSQWRKLKQYANEKGVQIVGDIPIFIAYQSAEVWARPDLFELDENNEPSVVAGVPPDYFSATGQRWGNPLYRWATHEKDQFAWWVERIKNTTQLVDIVRIDHFRGFAGYWEIPAHEQTAINGRWMPGPGEKLFTAIQNQLGKLPIIAEDLGVVTPDVVELLDKFELPGMRILQFAFGGGADNPYLPHNYCKNTVVYGGTHDNNTTRGWFDSASEREKYVVCKYLNCEGTEIHWDIIHAASQSVANIAIHAFQDVLGLDGEHRMNLPGQAGGYWEWRFAWDQVDEKSAERLYEICALHGRCSADRLKH
jgi:4-alpha-glucanotransferase